MQEQVRIQFDILTRVAHILFDHIQSLEGPAVSLDKDYFWAVVPEQLYNVAEEPSDHSVGQLSECAANLERIVADPSLASSYALVWLADLLRALGQTIVR